MYNHLNTRNRKKLYVPQKKKENNGSCLSGYPASQFRTHPWFIICET